MLFIFFLWTLLTHQEILARKFWNCTTMKSILKLHQAETEINVEIAPCGNLFFADQYAIVKFFMPSTLTHFQDYDQCPPFSYAATAFAFRIQATIEITTCQTGPDL